MIKCIQKVGYKVGFRALVVEGGGHKKNKRQMDNTAESSDSLNCRGEFS